MGQSGRPTSPEQTHAHPGNSRWRGPPGKSPGKSPGTSPEKLIDIHAQTTR